MKHILWFEEIGEDDIEHVGGKGANLGLMNDKYPIPPGFCITADSYFQILEQFDITDKISELLHDLDVENTDALQKRADKIKQLFLNLDLDEKIESIYYDTFDELTSGATIYTAIRSSATAEDLPEASFAGQQETYLGVDRENYIAAVKKCWASLFTPRAIYYREQNGFDHMKVGISVIVQQLIDAKVAGVLFTKSPSTGDENVIIEAGLGLGDTVVGGEITPDTYVVDPKSWEILSKDISNQEYKLIRDNNTTKEVKIDNGDNQKLTDDEIIDLAKIGISIEDHYDGQPQDIEWAIDDEIYVVQSRPITTIAEEETKTKENAKVLVSGLGASPGLGSGHARIILDADSLGDFEQDQILVTKMTCPDWVPAMKKASAIITDEGGTTSHAAIVSRELGVPAIVGTENATEVIDESQAITVDGDEGNVYQGIIETESETTDDNQQITQTQTTSSIVTATKVYVNLSSPDRASDIANQKVDGVGLLRAEFIAAQLGKHPRKVIDDEESEEWTNQLAENIRGVVEPFHPRPVVYRTLDFKTNEYKDLPGGEDYEPEENNPMLGYRGAHRNINDDQVFAMELQAIKKVRDGGLDNLHVMIPFVRTVNELESIIEVMKDHGLERSKDFKLWIMVEVPSTVFLIDQFLEFVDGISIGTNDLTQLILGVDRDNEHLSDLFDERDPAVLEALNRVITASNDKDKTSSVCGQAPTKYEEIVEFLVKIGVTSMSVSPDAVQSTRETIARIEKKQLLQKAR